MLSEDPLESIARVVLPTTLDDAARSQVVRRFWDWVDGFRPGVELMATEDTAYLMELPFSRPMVSAPVSPRARYEEQLEALEDEAKELHGVSFAKVGRSGQEAIVRAQVESAIDELHVHELNPLGAPALWLAGPAAFVGTPADHVAVTLMAFYFNSSEGVERSLGRSFRQRTCRGFAGVDEAPREREL